MPAVTLHRETVKAAIRMRYGSIEAFAEAHNMKSQVVRDLLRGTSSAAKPAVAELLDINPDHLVITRDSTMVDTRSNGGRATHRQNAGVR